MANLQWEPIDDRAVDTARVLAADAVEKVGNGHPGTAMSLAPAAYLLFQKVMRRDPADHAWLGRDRFILSAGHSSLTQYVQLYLAGDGLELDDLKALRTWGSKTPGHPEYGHTDGVEITTGPLGQGLSSAVGFAYASRYERGLFDPDAAPGTSPFDHFIYVIAGDGDLQEGVTSEASSLAGHQQLGNLVVIYDSNQISIEDDTNIAFTEDVAKRYEAYGWHVQTVDWKKTGEYVEDVAELHRAIEAAKGETSKPSIIILKTIIGWPCPGKQNTGKIHGSALGADELAATKEVLGFDPEQTFVVAEDVLEHTREARERGAAQHAEWQVGFDAWAAANPERKALLDRLEAGELPADVAVRAAGRSRAARRSRPVPHPARSSTPSPARSPSSGAARPTSPSRTSRRSTTPRRSSPPSGRPTSARATPTAACCTSASASTRWARSSTASCCTARPARSAARSSSSATTCARRCASRRS